MENEKITVVLPIKQFDEEHFVFMATAMGTVKKTALTDFSNPRKAGIIAVDLDAGDYLIGAAITDGKHDVMLSRMPARRCASTRTTCGRWVVKRAACGVCGWTKASR